MLNKVILIGRCGGQPETRFTQTGKAVTNFSLATDKKYKNSRGELEKSTEWHKITAWGKLAEICGQYLQKGSLIYIEGELQTRKWQDQAGNDRYTTEIIARELKMLDSQGNRQQGSGGNNQDGNRQPQQQGMFPGSEQSGHPGNLDDNVPF